MSQEEDRVRGEIKLILKSPRLVKVVGFNDAWFRETTKQILSIKGLRIEADDQSLPPNPYGARTNQEVYQRAIEDFKIKHNWVKVVGSK